MALARGARCRAARVARGGRSARAVFARTASLRSRYPYENPNGARSCASNCHHHISAASPVGCAHVGRWKCCSSKKPDQNTCAAVKATRTPTSLGCMQRQRLLRVALQWAGHSAGCRDAAASWRALALEGEVAACKVRIERWRRRLQFCLNFKARSLLAACGATPAEHQRRK